MYIPNDIIVSANKGAQRLMKELKGEPQNTQKTMYYLFIETFSTLHNKNNNAQKTMEELYKTFKWWNNSHDTNTELYDSKNAYYCLFWNTFTTTNKNGKKCDISEFKRYLRETYGDKCELYYFFDRISKNLYPDFTELKEKSYSFHWLSHRPAKIISFKARMDESTEKKILETFRNYNIWSIYDGGITYIEEYLKMHHIEYKDFRKQEIQISDNDVSTMADELLFHFNSRISYNEIPNLEIIDYEKHDVYYLVLDIGLWVNDGWGDEEYMGCNKVAFMAKKSNEGWHTNKTLIYQHLGDDENPNGITGFFEFQRLCDGKKYTVSKDDVVINNVSCEKLLDILLNANKINNEHPIDSIKAILNK